MHRGKEKEKYGSRSQAGKRGKRHELDGQKKNDHDERSQKTGPKVQEECGGKGYQETFTAIKAVPAGECMTEQGKHAGVRNSE